ncbi:hypothetical protein QBC44DRAFT_241068 [Cladorrhinum sp. PSN332]|nr:hypothetical protein QBC44DRAFT_241068 [Cladorrhinum sp. PSN332]
MGLCCRTAALRIFVNSLTQINLPVAASAHRLPQYPSIAARSSALSTAPSRSLQTSCSGQNEDPRGSYKVANITYHRLPQEGNPVDSTTTKKPRWTEEQKEQAKIAREAKALKMAKRGPKSPDDKVSKDEPATAKGKPKHDPKDTKYRTPRTKEEWRIQKEALKKKFPEGWNPRKRLSPDALAGIRALHAQFPEEYTTEKLSEKFELSPEAIRRILRSNWEPSGEEEEDRQMRWFRRGKSVWSHWAELGKKPPVRWRKEGIVRDPKWNKPKSDYIPRQMPDDFMG